MTERKSWVDLLRGAAILAILLDHTELYYAGDNIIDYNLYVANALTVFFFLSGYLFSKNTPFNPRAKASAILRTLLMPYFIFTALLALPKALAHGRGVADVFVDILLGRASWFVAALVVAELLMVLLLMTGRRVRSLLLGGAAVAGIILSGELASSGANLVWKVDNALLALPLLIGGYAYHRHEKIFAPTEGLAGIAVLAALAVVLKVVELKEGYSLLMEPIGIDSWPVFLADGAVVTLLMVNLAKKIGSCVWLEWVGRRSLVFYFFCGGVPLVLSGLMSRLGLDYDGSYLRVVLVYLMVCAAVALIAWLVCRYLFFLLGQRRRF